MLRMNQGIRENYSQNVAGGTASSFVVSSQVNSLSERIEKACPGSVNIRHNNSVSNCNDGSNPCNSNSNTENGGSTKQVNIKPLDTLEEGQQYEYERNSAQSSIPNQGSKPTSNVQSHQ